MKYFIDIVLGLLVFLGLVSLGLVYSDVSHADSICYMVDNLMVCSDNNW